MILRFSDSQRRAPFRRFFFPKLPPTQALVFSYLAYAAGHPARLLGAFIFGHFGDRSGRKFAFLINIVVVGASTCLTGLLPGYATIGIAAPILLVLLRIIQGIGVGGEFGGATSLLAEFGAKRRSRAFWMSLANLGLALGIMAASGMFLLLRKSFATTGWRVAMLLSAVIAIPALIARYKLSDSPLFQQLKQRQQLARLPSFAVFRRHAAPILLLATVSAFQNLDTAVTGTYIISFMHLAGIPLTTAAIIIFLSRFADVHGSAAQRTISRHLQAQKARLFRYRCDNVDLLSLRPRDRRQARRARSSSTMSDCAFRDGIVARARADSHLGDLPDKISILGHGHFLWIVGHSGWDDRAASSSKFDRSGRCSSLALSTSRLCSLWIGCHVGPALYSRDT